MGAALKDQKKHTSFWTKTAAKCSNKNVNNPSINFESQIKQPPRRGITGRHQVPSVRGASIVAPPDAPGGHPTSQAACSLTCRDSLGTALLHRATPVPASKTRAPASQGGPQPQGTAGPRAPMLRHWKGQSTTGEACAWPAGAGHAGGRTDLSSCWWKCWTFIWCAVLFLSRRNLQRKHTAPA